MFRLNEDMSIYVTRGDTATIIVSLTNEEGTPYVFQAGDVLRLKVFEKKNCNNVVLEKLYPITQTMNEVNLALDEKDTKIGGVISKPVDYWYEIELNPLSNPQTVIGYDEEGAKIFKLFPEGRDLEEHEYTEEEIPLIDNELDLTSTRPIQNQAVARAVIQIRTAISGLDALESRVDNFARLTNGSTTGDAELVDIRVGADGYVHTTAGNSVREQFNALNRCFELATENLFVPEECTTGYQLSQYGDLTSYQASTKATSNIINIQNNVTYSISPVTSNLLDSFILFKNGNDKTFKNESSGIFKISTMIDTYDWMTNTGEEVVFNIPSSYPVTTVRFALGVTEVDTTKVVRGEKYVSETTLKIRVPYLEEQIAQNNTSGKMILCYGDSLTAGAGGNGTTFPSVLQRLVGADYDVRNYGVGGETAQQIAGRQGGVPLMVIPPLNVNSTTWNNINVVSDFGSAIGLLGYQSSTGLHPCSLGGTAVTLHWDSSNKQTVKANDSGVNITINRPIALRPYSSSLKDKTLIIWSGTNGWGDDDVETLVEMQKKMIEYNGNNNYLVLGIHSTNKMAYWNDLENAQKKAFGYHYINIRDYLVKYGLEDSNLTATAEDTKMIAEGKVPAQLMTDGIHFTANAYTVIANVVYKRGKDLGYWN